MSLRYALRGSVHCPLPFIFCLGISLFYELAENIRDFNHEMNRLRTRRVF
jgi:hypothetical protein